MSPFVKAPVEISTGFEGFRLWPAALSPLIQKDLAAQVMDRLKAAPPYRPTTPGGRPFSVSMSNLGALGWVSDAGGYRYQDRHPLTGQAWPDIPDLLLQIWEATIGPDPLPDACLVNLYQDGARMGLHQDRDEVDLEAPVLSISLGDTGLFRIGPADGGATARFRLESGDICALTGPARLARHGIDKILGGSSQLLQGGGRLNLTLRRAG